jgi:hypothetical protein
MSRGKQAPAARTRSLCFTASLLPHKIVGDGQTEIASLTPIEEASPMTQLTWLGHGSWHIQTGEHEILLDGDTGGFGFHGGRHQAVLPNRPAGFTSRTIAMMTKMTTDEASG